MSKIYSFKNQYLKFNHFSVDKMRNNYENILHPTSFVVSAMNADYHT